VGARKSELSEVHALRQAAGHDQPGRGWATPSAKHASRIPSGHPEGYLDAFAQLYADLAEQIVARNAGRKPAASALLVPGIKEGWKEYNLSRES